MNPILNVELGEISVRLHVSSLSSGLKEAVGFFDRETQSLLSPYLENLTADSMKQIRELVPGLRVTAHFLPYEESRILDGH